MNYKKIVKEEYDIHFINNKDFHTIEFYITFTEQVTKKNKQLYFSLSVLFSGQEGEYTVRVPGRAVRSLLAGGHGHELDFYGCTGNRYRIFCFPEPETE